MTNRSKVKMNIPICLACVLLCLTLFSFCFTGGLHARYVTQAWGSDSARVARFDVTIQADKDMYSQLIPLGDIQPGGSSKIEFKVINNSEVAVAFTATVINQTKNLPLKIPMSGVPTQLDPNEEMTIEVVISWDKDDNDPVFTGKTDLLELRVAVDQVD